MSSPKPLTWICLETDPTFWVKIERGVYSFFVKERECGVITEFERYAEPIFG